MKCPLLACVQQAKKQFVAVPLASLSHCQGRNKGNVRFLIPFFLFLNLSGFGFPSWKSGTQKASPHMFIHWLCEGIFWQYKIQLIIFAPALIYMCQFGIWELCPVTLTLFLTRWLPAGDRLIPWFICVLWECRTGTDLLGHGVQTPAITGSPATGR